MASDSRAELINMSWLIVVFDVKILALLLWMNGRINVLANVLRAPDTRNSLTPLIT